MKKKSSSKSAFFNPRFLIGFIFCLAGVFLALLGFGLYPGGSALAQGPKQNQTGSGGPEVVRLIGPVSQNVDLRALPYIAPKPEFEERVLTRYPHGTGQAGAQTGYGISGLARVQAVLKDLWRPAPTMPPPLLTFDGINRVNSGCNCAPPDTDGDVGPNHYVEAVNESFKVFDKNGNTLAGPTTWNSFFAPLVGTPCNGFNDGDPFVFYDHMADRWVISDFAFVSFPGTNFYECIGVSQTPNPTGTWNLYALLVDATNLDDYPKMALWNNPQPGGAYYLTANLFLNGSTFSGVKVFALDRGSMLTGGPANAISFLIPPGNPGLGDSYSLVAANFRTGTAPPAGRDEMLLAVDSPASNPTTLTQVKGWLFHADFVTPTNSTLGIGASHAPNALITVNPFVEAWTNTTGFTLVPQQGTTQHLDTLGDKIMTPVVYQNRGGTESLWADQTNILNFPNGPTIIRWYQFNVTGGNFPATAVQQEDWSNGSDGLWRFMPSIAVDQNGNTAIGYSLSSPSMFPGIRYAGRLVTDPPNDLSQGEATMFTGTGSQTDTSGRWGDYTYTAVDPADGLTFWHVNEYYATTSSFNWATRIGKFQFPSSGCTPGPWTQAAPVGIDHYGGFIDSNGTFAYEGGGYSFSAADNINEFGRFNPTTNTWTPLAPVPDLNNGQASGVYAPNVNKLFVFGGEHVSIATVVNTTRIYDIATGVWSTGAPMPDVRAFMGSGYYNGKIYLVGGYTTGSVDPSFGQVWEYDPVLNTWNTSRMSMPITMGGPGFGIINGHIYIAGGRNLSNTNLNTLYDYDIAANTWTQRANLPTGINVPGSAVIGGKLWVFGGGNPFVGSAALPKKGVFAPDTTNILQIYDPATNMWSSGPTLNQQRSFPAGTHVGNTAVAVGGYTGSTTTTSVEINVTTGCAPTVTSAVSRKTHDGAGTFDIEMPLTGPSGVECRTGGATHDYSLVVTFSGNVTVTGMPQSQVITGSGCVGSGGTCDPNGTVSVSGNMVTVPLTNIADIQVINVQINGVNGASDEPAVNVTIPMGFLTGDVNGNRVVNSTDVAQTKSQVGQNVGSGNFREDVNASGTITATDVSIVKSDVGHALPP